MVNARAPKAGAKVARDKPAAAACGMARPDRRGDILASAEALFSQHGYHAVSVRDIATAANVPLALVGYYFGKKEELFRTIFEHRKAYITERLERIAGVDCSIGNKRAVEQIVRAWVEPALALRASEDGARFSMMVARTVLDSSVEVNRVTDEYFEPLVKVFVGAMLKALPTCTRDEIVWAYGCALGALMVASVDHRIHSRLSTGSPSSRATRQLEALVKFLTSGFESIAKAAPATTTARRRA